MMQPHQYFRQLGVVYFESFTNQSASELALEIEAITHRQHGIETPAIDVPAA